MNSAELERTRQRVTEVQALISSRERALREAPDDFGAQLALSSLRSHLDDLNRQVLVMGAVAEREFIDFRLIGNQVIDGTISLSLLSKIAGPLSDVVTAAACRFRYKDDNTSLARDRVQNMLDLRLVALGEGSTHLYLTGNASPDLSGQSLLEESMKQLFALLNADQSEFFDSVHAMGPRAARAAEELLKVMESEEIAAELTWAAPDSTNYHWVGRTDRITQLRSLLEQTEERQTETVELHGAISLLSDMTRLEIREDGKSRATKIRYDKNQLPIIADLTVGQRVILEVEKTSFFDKSEQRLIERYRLSRIVV